MGQQNPAIINFNGGLDMVSTHYTNQDQAGSAREMVNMEPSLNGGYRRINGWQQFGNTTIGNNACSETSQEVTSNSFWYEQANSLELLTPVYSGVTDRWTFDYDMDTDTGIDAWLVSYLNIVSSRPASISVTLGIDRTSGKTVPNSLVLNVWLTEWETTTIDDNAFTTLGVALTFDTTGLGAAGIETVTVSGDITYPADNTPKSWGIGALRFADTPTEFSADAVYITDITLTGCADWWAGP